MNHAALPLLIQRAKIGKNSEGKSGNATSRFDSNGNQDRMKLADFNFLMVLGKGSFGKVRPRPRLCVFATCVLRYNPPYFLAICTPYEIVLKFPLT